jgi:hypothetical protein
MAGAAIAMGNANNRAVSGRSEAKERDVVMVGLLQREGSMVAQSGASRCKKGFAMVGFT